MTPDPADGGDIDAVIAYHNRTKHHFHRYAASLGYMDWANQPDPFRRYDGARRFLLPFRDDDSTPRYDEIFGAVPPQSLNVESLSLFFEHSLGISATKSHGGSSWKLRCNPSSGNLHPTEGYVIAGPLEGLSTSAGVFHYMPEDHALELRAELSELVWNTLSAGFPPATIFVGLASIHWREAWKYGERAFRYCHHDTGHALGALRLSAAALGWRCVMLDALSDDDTDALLGVTGRELEPEYGEALLAVITRFGECDVPNAIGVDSVRQILDSAWSGTPNALSAEHVDWDIIPAIAGVCRKPGTHTGTRRIFKLSSSPPSRPIRPETAYALFRQRRSAVALDGRTSISRDAFYRMLAATLPSETSPPFDCWPFPPYIDLALFVHRVDGLSAGVYALVRDDARTDALRAAMRADFAWSRPDGCPDSLPLFLLGEADCRGLAAKVSCLQSIAADGAFSLGMLARFEDPLARHGAWFYPRLFWETGLIGQVLYLEAEAAGVRATGIGCYFDDAVHDVLGLRGHAFQSLYHFTVGGPVDDPRITGLPPYDAERRKRRGWV